MITAEELVISMQKEEKNYFKLATVMELFENQTAKIKFDGEDTPSEKQYAYLDSYVPKEDDRVLLGVLGGTYVILGKVNYNVPPSKEEEIDRYLFDLKQVIMEKGLNIKGDTIAENIEADNINSVSINTDGITAESATITQSNIENQTSTYINTNTLETITALITELTVVIGNIDNINAKGTLNHTGTTLGFYGKIPVTKRPINKFTNPATFTLQDAYTGINNVVDQFWRYGLG